jgi:hypothetical protein
MSQNHISPKVTESTLNAHTELLSLALAIQTILELTEDLESQPYQKLHALLKPIHHQMQHYLAHITVELCG